MLAPQDDDDDDDDDDGAVVVILRKSSFCTMAMGFWFLLLLSRWLSWATVDDEDKMVIKSSCSCCDSHAGKGGDDTKGCC